MNLLVSFRSELLKTRRTATVYFTVIAAAIIPCLSILAIALDGMETDPGEDPFSAILDQRFNFLSGAIFPIYIMLVCTLLAQIEFRNNTWKQVFASPQSKLNVFIARFLNVHVVILLFILLYNVFLALSIVIIHFMVPSAHLLDQHRNWSELIMWNTHMYLGMLALSAIQFWLSLRFRNFVVSLGVGLTLWLVGVMMVMGYNVRGAYFFPYTYTAYSGFPYKFKDIMPAVQWGSFGYMMLFLIIGFIDFRRGKR